MHRYSKSIAIVLGGGFATIISVYMFLGGGKEPNLPISPSQEFSEMDKDHLDSGGSVVDPNEYDEVQSIEIAKAIDDFKSNSTYESYERAARTLLPLIKVGATQQEILSLLGEPRMKSDGGRGWVYPIFYGEAIAISFDSDGKVKSVTGSEK